MDKAANEHPSRESSHGAERAAQELVQEVLASIVSRAIAAGDAPVFFGFGSMPVQDPKALVEKIAAITASRGLRALIGAGWSDFGSSELPAHVRIASAFDHDRVLPLCLAALHHGGAGTTAAALRADLPSLIVSCFGDQPFWGWRLTQLGAGTTFPFPRLSAARRDAGLQRILCCPDAAADLAALCASMLRREPGERPSLAALLEHLDARDEATPARRSASSPAPDAPTEVIWCGNPIRRRSCR
jgi:sterol 3beta-glucosyltransferase